MRNLALAVFLFSAPASGGETAQPNPDDVISDRGDGLERSTQSTEMTTPMPESYPNAPKAPVPAPETPRAVAPQPVPAAKPPSFEAPAVVEPARGPFEAVEPVPIDVPQAAAPAEPGLRILWLPAIGAGVFLAFFLWARHFPV
jgi:hypothetical protein